MSSEFDMRSFIDTLEKGRRLTRDKKRVSPKFEVASRIADYQRASKKAILFERVKGYDIPIVSNLLAGRELVSLALNVQEDRLLEDWVRLEKRSVKKRQVSDGHCKENIFLNQKADLTTFPIVTHYERDAGPYLTAGILVFKKDDDVENASFNRMQVVGKRKLRIRLNPGMSHAELYHAEHEKKREPMDAAVCIGNNPHLMLAAATRVPIECDELDFAGGLRNRPLEVVACETVDVDVPADSEIIIEGKILNGVREKEGPFADFSGYYSTTEAGHVFKVTAITCRHRPIYQTILCGGIEDLSHYVSVEAQIYKSLRALGLSVKDVRICASPFHYAVAVRKTHDDDSSVAIRGAFRVHPWVRMCTIVDEDVDISNSADLLWAISTRCNRRDGILTEGDRLGIDATVNKAEKEKFNRVRLLGTH